MEKQSPNSSLRIRSEQGAEALKLLDSNEIDFAIGRFEMVSSRFGSIELYTEKYVGMYDEFKAWLAKEAKLSIEQYLSSKHLRVAPAGTPVAPIDRTLNQLNLEREIFARIDLYNDGSINFEKFRSSFNASSKTAQRIAKNYNFSISELPLDLEKRQPNCYGIKSLLIILLMNG